MPKSNEVKRAGRSKVSIPSSFSPLESSPKVVPKRTNGAAKRQPSMSGMNGDPQTGASGYFMGICVIIGLSLAVLVVLTLSMPHFYGRLEAARLIDKFWQYLFPFMMAMVGFAAGKQVRK